MQVIPASELVRAFYRAYETRDRASLEMLLADDFTYTSPCEDHISRADYLERCWPAVESLRAFEIERCLSESGEVFVTRSGEQMDGSRFRNTEYFATTGAKISAMEAYFGAGIPNDGKGAEADVQAVLDKTVEAIRARDALALMEHYAAGVVAFDLLPPLRYEGETALQKRVIEWLESFTGPLEYELNELRIAAGNACAFAHSLNHVRGTRPGHELVDMWWRATLGLEKLEGVWKITHAHSSEPFNMETGRAETMLRP
jgi:ketosteroid isomerase-like protein